MSNQPPLQENKSNKSNNMRISLMFVILFLHLNIYKNTPQRHSAETVINIPKFDFRKGWLKQRVTNITKYYIIYSIIILLDILFFYYIAVRTNKIPKKIIFSNIDIVIIFALIGILGLYTIRKQTKPVLELGTYISCPKYIPNQKKRHSTHHLLLLLYIIQFVWEFIKGYKPAKIIGFKDILLSRFGSLGNNIYQNIAFFCGWSRVIGLILEVIAYNTTKRFSVCKYNLPNSWHF